MNTDKNRKEKAHTLHTVKGPEMSFDIGAEDCFPLSSISSSCSSYSFNTHVSYSCGSCGYELNLNSCNRIISGIDAKYGKSMKRGVISFFSIDESRFTQKNRFRWLPYLGSKSSWRMFQRRTKLLCRNCGEYIGVARITDDASGKCPSRVVKQRSTTWDGISARTMYEIKLRSLRPVSPEMSTLLI